MTFNLGVNVVETDGKAPPAIAAAPTSTAAFLLRSLRGVPDRAVPLRGFSDFVARFGSFSADAFGAFAVRGFFDNGGRNAWASRVVGAGARAAEVTLDDSLAAGTLQVEAGFMGLADPGIWGNELAVHVSENPLAASAVPAQISGTELEPFALSDGDVLSVTVQGAATPLDILFTTSDIPNLATARASEVAAVINRQTTAVRAATTADNRLLLWSAAAGAASHLAIAGRAAIALGFGAGNDRTPADVGALNVLAVVATGGLGAGSAVRLETAGHRVATSAVPAALADGSSFEVAADGADPVTVRFTAADFQGGVGAITGPEVVAAINRQAVGFRAELDDENRVVLLSAGYGFGSSIELAAGALDAMAPLGLDGTSVPGASATAELDEVSEVSRTLVFDNPPGALPVLAARLRSTEFDLAVLRAGTEVERFEQLSMQATLGTYAPSVVNDSEAGSRYVRLDDLASSSGAGLNVPVPGTFQLGAGVPTAGADGSAPTDADYAGDPAERTGLFSFDGMDVQLLACPETASPAVTTAALAYCENRGTVTFVGTAPRGSGLEGLHTHAAAFRGTKVFGAFYGPWIQILDPLDSTGNKPYRWIPPVGHVLGVYARTAAERGVWKAPAGDSARLRGVLAVEFDMTDTDHTALVKSGGVNGIRAIPGAGIVVDASRTLSTDSRWLFVGTRRLMNFVKASLADSLRWVPQEPHDEELRRKVRLNVITPFLLGLWRQGAFGSEPPEDVFTVKCDTENNPPAEVQLGNFRVEVYFYPVSPVETIVLTIGQQDSGASAQEV